MSFSDEDLKRLKERFIDTGHPRDGQIIKLGEVQALLTRLEAAERCVRLGIDEQYGSKTWFDAQEAWKKSCGR